MKQDNIKNIKIKPARFLKPSDKGFRYEIINKKNLKKVKKFFNVNGYRCMSSTRDGKTYLWVNDNREQDEVLDDK